MVWDGSNPVSIGDPTKKTHYDRTFDNIDFLHTQPGLTKTANYPVTTSDAQIPIILGIATAADRTFTLPSVGASEDGMIMIFENQSDYEMNILGNDSDAVWKYRSEGIVSTTRGGFCKLRYDHASTMWVVDNMGGGRWMIYGLKLYVRCDVLTLENVNEGNGALTLDLSYRHHVLATQDVQVIQTDINFGINHFQFNGLDEELHIADSPDWDIFGTFSGSHTVSMWVRCNDAAGNVEELIAQHQNTDNLWEMRRNAAGALNIRLRIAGSTVINMSGGTISQTTWHFITLFRVASDVAGYIDGSQVSYAGSFSDHTFPADLFFAQNGNSSEYFKGRIQDIQVCNQNPFKLAPNPGFTDTFDVPKQLLELVSGP